MHIKYIFRKKKQCVNVFIEAISTEISRFYLVHISNVRLSLLDHHMYFSENALGGISCMYFFREVPMPCRMLNRVLNEVVYMHSKKRRNKEKYIVILYYYFLFFLFGNNNYKKKHSVVVHFHSY